MRFQFSIPSIIFFREGIAGKTGEMVKIYTVRKFCASMTGE